MEGKVKDINELDDKKQMKESKKRMHDEIRLVELNKKAKQQKRLIDDISKALKALVYDCRRSLRKENADFEKKLREHKDVMGQIVSKIIEKSNEDDEGFKRPISEKLTGGQTEEHTTDDGFLSEGRVLKRVKIDESQ